MTTSGSTGAAKDDRVVQGATVAVAVVDDDAIVRDWIRQALGGTEFRIVGEGGTAEEARVLVERRRPSLLIVDYKLPDQRATELVRALRKDGLRIPVLVMTATASPGLNELALESGAAGVVLKRSDRAALLRALRDVAGGVAVVDPEHPRLSRRAERLTPREREVLALAAAGARNREIGARLGLGSETVKTLLSRAFLKLGARNRTEAASLARERGLL